MERLRKFNSLPAAERRLLFQSLLLVSAIRLGLWLLTFYKVQRLLRWMTKRRSANSVPHRDGRPTVARIVWSVKVVSRYIPAASCLVQALAAHTLLNRQGYQASLRVGVAKGRQGELRAHAWVACQDNIVIGGAESASRFTPLPPLEKEVM